MMRMLAIRAFLMHFELEINFLQEKAVGEKKQQWRPQSKKKKRGKNLNAF
jgi:hypothetical protein